MGDFIWGGAVPSLARSTLTLPVPSGGLSLPDLRVYFWVAVLVSARWWFMQSRDNAAVCLEAGCPGVHWGSG